MGRSLKSAHEQQGADASKCMEKSDFTYKNVDFERFVGIYEYLGAESDLRITGEDAIQICRRRK